MYEKSHAAIDSIVFNSVVSPTAMRPYFGVSEDTNAIYTPEVLFAQPDLFTAVKNFKSTNHSNVFWLFTRIHTRSNVDVALSFRHLTDCDLYIMPDTPGAVYSKQLAGAFRPAEQLSSGDSRFHFQLRLAAETTYLVLIRSQHAKHYKPVFDFELDDLYNFNKVQRQREVIDFWFQGAAMLLLLYVLISWFTTRYNPYLWLAMFITGLMFYNLALSRYFIDWFFSSYPSLGWKFTIHFMHLGLAGLYLLILDFWKIKEKNYVLYKWGKNVLSVILFLSCLSFVIYYYTANFRIMSQVNGLFLIIQVIYLLRLLLLWKSFDKQERLLGYGVILYLLVALSVTIGLFVIGESIFNVFSILSGSILVIVSLLFLIGINGKLWQNEKDKALYLTQLTQLQQQQNELLEAGVIERTNELRNRNRSIELLMNELNHRVKNNLQLLYSLNSLQLAGSKDVYADSILRDNVARIKAMMLVNDSLNPGNNSDKKNILPAGFIADIAAHSKKIFTQSGSADISLRIDQTLVLDATSGLCLGLIVTELLTNSYKHAFTKQSQPQIVITILHTGDLWQMHYQDNGVGINTSSGNSFGLTLIADLTRQLKGHYKLLESSGVHYLFNFPNPV